ncbi:sensor histidine kinase [Pseudoxanthomonas sp. LjRoot143]|uniref:sensor histidine kinase n=1 Tax=Pseudoxanthomonas sp. LjRoot143 TaxID=3342266 RepID=UPI003F4FA1CC
MAAGPAAPLEQRARLYETLLQVTPDLVYMWDLQHRFTYANAALLAMWGMTWDEAIGKNCLEIGYEPWHAALHDREIEQVVATRQPVRGDVPFNGTNGRRIYDYLLMPVIGPDGQVEAVAGTTRDVTDRKLHEDARRRSEERLAAMVDATTDLVYRTNADWSEVDIVGGSLLLGRHGSLTPDWLEVLIHPDDRDRVRDAIAHARATQTPYEAEHRVRNDDGGWSWVSSRAVPIRPIGGQITEWFGAATDISERKRHEEHQRLLLAELNHRVKNTLAIVQSIALQTLGTNGDASPAYDRFEARLHALSQAHDMLTLKQWVNAPLEAIVRTAIAPCTQGDNHRFTLQGFPIELEPQRALALTMALHELCTNAMKYGALSGEHGHVDIRWTRETRDGRDCLVLRWEERDGPPVATPERRGFGSRMIERGLRHDLGGHVSLEFLPTGVVCEITAPLANTGAVA